MRLETLDRFPPELDAIARQSSHASFYHTTSWLECLAKSFPEWQPRCIIARSGEDILGYLPFFMSAKRRIRKCWSLPFGTYGGPVVVDTKGIDRQLADRFASMRDERDVHEVGLVDFFNRVDAPRMLVENSAAHVIDLDVGFDDIWTSRFNQSKRRQARKAGREGVTVAETSATDDVGGYYAIYKKRSEEWKQAFVYPETLFVELLKTGGARLFVARLGEQLLGGLLNLYFGDMVIAWHGASVRTRHGSLASTLLYSSCIRHACDHGYKRFNLGSSLGKGSLMHYKEVLGGVEHPYRVLRWRSVSMGVATTARRLLRYPGRR